MAIRPQRLETLRHGRLLTGRVFRFFVETWNWLISYVDNLAGDFDVNPQTGHITVDRSKGDRPVIRLRPDVLRREVFNDGPFAPVFSEDGVKVSALVDRFYQVGGVTHEIEGPWDVPTDTSGIICVRVGATTANRDADMVIYPDMSALNAAQENLEYVIVPLYILEGGAISVDLRKIPHIQVAEAFA